MGKFNNPRTPFVKGKFKKDTRNKLLAALFAEAKKKGIDADFLRDVIAKNIISKRLSEAAPQEIMAVLTHITQKSGVRSQESGVKKYESSKRGLLMELEDIAKERWGGDFQSSLNAFINCNRNTPTHYRFLDVTTMKAIKERIKEMNKDNEVA